MIAMSQMQREKVKYSTIFNFSLSDVQHELSESYHARKLVNTKTKDHILQYENDVVFKKNNDLNVDVFSVFYPA